MQLVCNLGHSSSKILPDVAATMFEANSSSDSWEVNKHRMISLTFLGKHTAPYVTCRSAEGLSQVCHRSVQSYSRPIWRKTEVCKSAYCLWQTSHENDFFFDCVLPFILFAASLLQTFRDFWWLCNKDLLLCLHLICSRRCADNHPHETCGAVQRQKIASK